MRSPFVGPCCRRVKGLVIADCVWSWTYSFERNMAAEGTIRGRDCSFFDGSQPYVLQRSIRSPDTNILRSTALTFLIFITAQATADQHATGSQSAYTPARYQP